MSKNEIDEFIFVIFKQIVIIYHSTYSFIKWIALWFDYVLDFEVGYVQGSMVGS